MRIRCQHGFFKFYETRPGQVSAFSSLFGLVLVPSGDFYTFEALEDAPTYSLVGSPYLGTIATVTAEGTPAEVMELNEMVFNFQTGLVVPIISVTNICVIETAGAFFISEGLVLPGSITSAGKVKSYDCWFSQETQKFRYSAVEYV